MKGRCRVMARYIDVDKLIAEDDRVHNGVNVWNC